jgi:beta-phosphoglucomutase
MNILDFDAYLFDMDGVLADTNPQHKIAFKQFLATKGIDCTDAFFDEHISGNSNEAIVRNILGNEVTIDTIKSWANEKEALFREIYKDFMQPLQGVIPFLDVLHKANKKLAVCTSAPIENLDFLLDGINIRSYFNVTLCEKDVTRHKPDPQVYLKALDMLSVAPEQAVVFEDSSKGATAGVAAGCTVVVVNNPNLIGNAFAANIKDFDHFL